MSVSSGLMLHNTQLTSGGHQSDAGQPPLTKPQFTSRLLPGNL